jgi:hypothetical protein
MGKALRQACPFDKLRANGQKLRAKGEPFDKLRANGRMANGEDLGK